IRRPTNIPKKITRKKLVAASRNWNCPVITAASANRNTISDEASLSKLSPSAMLTSDLGTFTRRMMVIAEIASGGEMMAPSRNPNANVKPGMSALDTNAITHDVMITIGKAKLVITRLHFQNSFHETCHDASHSRGGRKRKEHN